MRKGLKKNYIIGEIFFGIYREPYPNNSIYNKISIAKIYREYSCAKIFFNATNCNMIFYHYICTVFTMYEN